MTRSYLVSGLFGGVAEEFQVAQNSVHSRAALASGKGNGLALNLFPQLGREAFGARRFSSSRRGGPCGCIGSISSEAIQPQG